VGGRRGVHRLVRRRVVNSFYFVLLAIGGIVLKYRKAKRQCWWCGAPKADTYYGSNRRIGE
jgi:hypothetical protein